MTVYVSKLRMTQEVKTDPGYHAGQPVWTAVGPMVIASVERTEGGWMVTLEAQK